MWFSGETHISLKFLGRPLGNCYTSRSREKTINNLRRNEKPCNDAEFLKIYQYSGSGGFLMGLPDPDP
jgi:hypothetical protein